ncbi:hypothetical protein RB195_021573 [Necator americanus]|uniref:Uncharacterized protein n=1 Tax=Necator americanus TaxID=51031 RepID=A0ABR1EBP4_NECAM
MDGRTVGGRMDGAERPASAPVPELRRNQSALFAFSSQLGNSNNTVRAHVRYCPGDPRRGGIRLPALDKIHCNKNFYTDLFPRKGAVLKTSRIPEGSEEGDIAETLATNKGL